MDTLDDDTNDKHNVIGIRFKPVPIEQIGRAIQWRLFRVPSSSRAPFTFPLVMPDGALYVSQHGTEGEATDAARALVQKGYRGIVQVAHEHGMSAGFDTLTDASPLPQLEI